MLLRKMTSAAMLSPKEAAEEFRHGVVKCIQALFDSLRPCDDSTCSCKLTSSSPLDAFKENPLGFRRAYGNGGTESKDFIAVADGCALGCLQSQNMSAAIGHLMSLLLQVCDS
jgi:hypothetical protein